MAEYIDREAASCIANYAVDESPYDKNPMKPETLSEYSRGWNAACDYIRDKLETAQAAADVAPVVHGRWVSPTGTTAIIAVTARSAAEKRCTKSTGGIARVSTLPARGAAREWAVKAMARLIDADIALENIDGWLDTVFIARMVQERRMRSE